MADDTLAKLRAIITPELLLHLHDTILPAPGSGVDEFLKPFTDDAGQGEMAKELYKTTFDSVFIPLTQIPLSDYPADLMLLLPDRDAPDFPIYATGLLLLFDRVPRHILKRHNKRWAFGWFDQLARRLAIQADQIAPDGPRMDKVETWFAANPQFTWADATIRRSLFAVPLEHAEDIKTHRRSLDLIEDVRQATEAQYKRPDPSRTDERARVDAVDSLPRLVSGVIPPPYFQTGDHSDYFFFECQVGRAHTPVLDRFGRYPWRNGFLGRDNTAEEIAYLDSIDNFSPVEDEVAKDLREDVKAGIWRPLYHTGA